jgi:hypothetical protein
MLVVFLSFVSCTMGHSIHYNGNNIIVPNFTFQRCYHGSLFTPSSYKRAYVSNTVTTEMSILKFIPAKIIFYYY